MGELTYPCAGCGATFFERDMKWISEYDDKDANKGQSIPYCLMCWEKEMNILRIRELLIFARGLLVKWERDCPNSAEYLKGYISALEIVLALLKG